MSASHGNTPAAWTAVSIMFVGFLVSGLALPFELPWLFFVGLGAAAVILRARHWPQPRSRYDTPAGTRTAAPRDTWEALDRGEDPTA